MQRFPKPDHPRSVLYGLCGYLAAICLLVGLGIAALADFTAPAEKIGAASPARATTGVAATHSTPAIEISAAKDRMPTWIAATTRYNYTPPSSAQQAKKQAPAATAATKKPKRRQAPDVAESSQALGYAGPPLQSAVFQSPLYRDAR